MALVIKKQAVANKEEVGELLLPAPPADKELVDLLAELEKHYHPEDVLACRKFAEERPGEVEAKLKPLLKSKLANQGVVWPLPAAEAVKKPAKDDRCHCGQCNLLNTSGGQCKGAKQGKLELQGMPKGSRYTPPQDVMHRCMAFVKNTERAKKPAPIYVPDSVTNISAENLLAMGLHPADEEFVRMTISKFSMDEAHGRSLLMEYKRIFQKSWNDTAVPFQKCNAARAAANNYLREEERKCNEAEMSESFGF